MAKADERVAKVVMAGALAVPVVMVAAAVAKVVASAAPHKLCMCILGSR